MTINEAITIIKGHKCFALGHPGGAEAFDMAVAALKKYVPKHVKWEVDHSWGVEGIAPVCPECDYYLTNTQFFGDGEKLSYCEHCGQVVDWRKEDGE